MAEVLVNEPLNPAVVRAQSELRSALEAPLELWRRVAPRQWELRSEPRSEAGVEHLDVTGQCDQRLINLLERVHATGRTCRATVVPQLVAIAAPLAEENGKPTAVAVVEVDAACGAYAERLAESLLREFRSRDEVEWLREENFVFSQQVTDDFEELTYLRQMATQLVVKDTSLDIYQLVQQSIGGLREMIGAESVYFVQFDDDRRPRVVQVATCGALAGEGADPAVVTRLADMYRERAAIAPCVKNDIRQTDAAARSAGVRQFLMVPICAGPRSFGWFVALNRNSAGRQWPPSPLLQLGQDEFGTWEASLLGAAATLIASHAANLDLIREKENLLISMIRTLVSALDSKDAYTRGHSERVALFCRCIARRMGYDEGAVEKLYLSGLLHDVGKIGVSDAVLRKPDRLTAEEYEEMKRHPDDGWAILRDLEQLNYLLPGVLHHHEQVNGTGYPDGLRGDQIPLDARIMAVADAYDAMTSDRAYRRGMPHEKALQILQAGAGSQWDATVVDAFLATIDDITAIRYGYATAERPSRQGPALAPSCRG